MEKARAKWISVLLLLLVTGACASAEPVPEAAELGYSKALLARTANAPATAPAAPPSGAPAGAPAAVVPPLDEAGLVADVLSATPDRIAELEGPAADEDALGDFLASPIREDDLAALAYLRSPEVDAARDRYDAARTGYRQSADLEDLLDIYRAFVEETGAPGGPTTSPGRLAFSGEIVRRTLLIAREDLRAAVVSVAAAAIEVHADAARLAAAVDVRRRDLGLMESLLAVMKARLESGQASQAGYLALAARVETLRTELAVLTDRRRVVLARLNRLLHRPAAAAANLDLPFAERPAPTTTHGVGSNPGVRKAGLMAERAEIAVRMGEVMLARPSHGGVRRAVEAKSELAPYEQEHAVDWSSARSVRTRETTGQMVRADFGVRESQVEELRARARALAAAREAETDAARVALEKASFERDSAARRLETRRREVLPRAEKAYESARGAWEGNRAGYLDLLDAARQRLDAELAVVDARKELAAARAAVLRATGAKEK